MAGQRERGGEERRQIFLLESRGQWPLHDRCPKREENVIGNHTHTTTERERKCPFLESPLGGDYKNKENRWGPIDGNGKNIENMETMGKNAIL